MNLFTKFSSSLKVKLISIVMTVSILGLVIFSGIFYLFETNAYKDAMIQKLEVLSKVIASRTTAAIIFQDESMLKENLQSLSAYESVTSAVILDVDKNILAYYGKKPEKKEFIKMTNSLKTKLVNDNIFYSQPINMDNENIGVLVLKVSLDELKDRQIYILELGLLLVGLMVLLSYLITLKLQGIILKPILALTSIAKQVDMTNDYSLRPKVQSSDEIGILTDTFSNMLKTIEEKNTLLMHELNSSEKLSEQIIDSIPLSVVVSNYDGKILRANIQALKEYSVELDDLDKYNIMDFYENQSDREKVLKAIKSSGSIKQHIVGFKDIYGLKRKVMLSVIPIEYGLQKALLSIAVDITKRVEMEEALVEARDRADSANKSKSEFLSNMSHEIRTPMNAIIGFTELLNEQISEPRLKSYVKTIQSAGNTLLILINDILDLSKIEAGKLRINKTPTNIFSISNEISSIFIMSVRNKGLDFIVEVDENIPKSLLIDEIRLRQILINIIGNAIKFTDTGFVKLLVKAHKIDKHRSKVDLEFAIKDSGIGIPKNQLESIFNEFEQTNGQDNRKFGGTGLGLPISKRLCEMMDGKISVSSVEEKGTTFYVYLYDIDVSSVIQEKQRDKKLSSKNISIIFKPSKVLVVDDIEDNRELIIKNFEDTEIEIVTANDGLEAIDKYKSEKPDLILMDIRMPNMDGYKASSAIKKISNVPIVALTASVMKDDFELLKHENFDGFLRKPILKYDLFSELSNFLEYEKSEISNEEEKFVLSDKAKSNIKNILYILDTEIIPLHQLAIKNNNLSDIKNMASKIKSLALKYDVDVLDQYASKLNEAVEFFDILMIEQLLQKFTNIQESLTS